MDNTAPCNRCKRVYELVLTTEFELLCHYCLDNTYSRSLFERFEESEAQQQKNIAMKRIWNEIKKQGKQK